MFIDSHSHLEGKRYDSDRDEVLARAKQNGIEAYLAIGNGDGPDTADCGIKLAEEYGRKPEYPRIWASVGIHPHEARLANEAADAKMLQWADHPKVIAWGEIGLDYFYDHSPRDLQERVFRDQMMLAAQAKLPIIIHCRDAWADCLRLIEEVWRPTGLGGILHCFTSTLEDALRGIDMGFLISFAGNSTYPKTQNLRDVAKALPLENILIETDSPYLAPQAYRGKRNEPAYVAEVARTLASVRDLAAEEFAARTAGNFRRFFHLSQPSMTAAAESQR